MDYQVPIGSVMVPMRNATAFTGVRAALNAYYLVCQNYSPSERVMLGVIFQQLSEIMSYDEPLTLAELGEFVALVPRPSPVHKDEETGPLLLFDDLSEVKSIINQKFGLSTGQDASERRHGEGKVGSVSLPPASMDMVEPVVKQTADAKLSAGLDSLTALLSGK